jgi:hypothetical protein
MNLAGAYSPRRGSKRTFFLGELRRCYFDSEPQAKFKCNFNPTLQLVVYPRRTNRMFCLRHRSSYFLQIELALSGRMEAARVPSSTIT